MSANKKRLILGIIISLAFTVIYYVCAVSVSIISASSLYSHQTLITVISVIRDIIEVGIYGAGAAVILAFLRLDEMKFAKYAYIAVLLVLFVDYGASFCVDFALGNIDGIEGITALYLLLNFATRAILYALTIMFAKRAFASAKEPPLPIPFVSLKNASSRMLVWAFFVRVTPYLIFELYSNITGIIEYGFDMTGSDVLSIISAYVEILLSGVIAYTVMYLLCVLYLSVEEKTEPTCN